MAGRIDPGWIAMLSLVLAALRSLAAGFRARRNIVLENLALRHQQLGGAEPQDQVPYPSQLRPAFLGNPQRDLVAVDEGVGDRRTSQILKQNNRYRGEPKSRFASTSDALVNKSPTTSEIGPPNLIHLIHAACLAVTDFNEIRVESFASNRNKLFMT